MMRRVKPVLFLLLLCALLFSSATAQQGFRVLYWGTTGQEVRSVQSRLKQWGYYNGPVDGVFGTETSRAVRLFQSRNGLPVDGVVGRQTWNALGLPSTAAPAAPAATPAVASSHLNLLARVVAAEARNEPFTGQVAVAAVILNRVRDPRFPNTLPGVIYQPHAFESVTNGLVWRRTPTATEVRAARQALNGWDPTYGSVFFWNPSKPVSRWIWTRPIVLRLGNHVFAR